MEKLKKIFSNNFEIIIVFILIAAVAFVIYIAVDKIAFLNFFYLPTLIAAYFLGKKRGILVSVLVVLLVSFYAILDPALFTQEAGVIPIWNLMLWGSFLIITAYVVGNLYEAKTGALGDLKQAYEGVLQILLKFIDSLD
ncbi:MAG: hypothetical protein KAS39_09105, partial [Actinomycetia bacterium]|nr:hypothetical protein [Actinomycetes bacterium]